MPFTLNRRRFLAMGASITAGALLGPVRAAGERVRLPIPTLLDGTSGDPIDLRIQRGQWSFMPGIQTSTLGINQQYLGPTIRCRRNNELNLHYENTLTEQVSIHGHGLHVPGDVDGGPQLAMAPGEKWQPSISIAQPAATCWYHSHTHGYTGSQVYRGLAGMMIIDDEESDALGLPSQYGIDDLPVIIQDRTFDSAGGLVYSLEDADDDGWYGNTVVINGAIDPVAHVPAGKVRLRLLNGANARFYVVAFSDNRVFHKIATDGGLLETPIPLTTMEMAPGERCEIIIDLSDGNSANLLTLFEDDIDEDEEGVITSLVNLFSGADGKPPQPSLVLVADRTLKPNTRPLPDLLTRIERPAASEIVRTREFLLEMENSGENQSHSHGSQGHHSDMSMTINGAVMDMNVINERVNKGVWERWRIRSDDGAHPFHIHGCSFLVEQMEGAAAPPEQQGWKDVVVLDDDDWSEVIVKFDHTASEKFPYMYHCHILEHEDHGMMGQFTVT